MMTTAPISSSGMATEQRRLASPGSAVYQNYQPQLSGSGSPFASAAGDDFIGGTGAIPVEDTFASSGSRMVMGSHGIAETVEAAKVKNLFHDSVFHRCTLCDEQIGNWMGHVIFVPHQARLGIVERVLTGLVGPPEQVVERWWGYLNENRGDATHFRLQGLSHETQDERRKRIVYLLAYLVEKGVLRHSLKVWDPKLKQFARSLEFERLEMIGDNIIKCVVQDRMLVAFPPEDGGLGAKLNWIQQLIDSNEGLLRLFDYLSLDKIIGAPLAQSKFKSDVVECLFGEIQVFLWACADPQGSMTTAFDLPNMYAEFPTMRALMEHLLFELTDVVLMYALESTVKNSMPILKAHYTPIAPHSGRRRSGGGSASGQRSRGRSAAADDNQISQGGASVIRSKYDLKPLLTDMALPALATSTANVNVVVLRGANVEAKVRRQAATRHQLVQPLLDFARSPRQQVPSGATALTDGGSDPTESRLMRAIRLDAVWHRQVTTATAARIAALDDSDDNVPGLRRTASLELRRAHRALIDAYSLRCDEFTAMFDDSLQLLNEALSAAPTLSSGPAATPPVGGALQRCPVEPPSSSTRSTAAWLYRGAACVASDFSQMRPSIAPRPRIRIHPDLQVGPSEEVGDDGTVTLLEAALPDADAAENTISELTSWRDETAAHHFTTRHARRVETHDRWSLGSLTSTADRRPAPLLRDWQRLSDLRQPPRRRTNEQVMFSGATPISDWMDGPSR